MPSTPNFCGNRLKPGDFVHWCQYRSSLLWCATMTNATIFNRSERTSMINIFDYFFYYLKRVNSFTLWIKTWSSVGRRVADGFFFWLFQNRRNLAKFLNRINQEIPDQYENDNNLNKHMQHTYTNNVCIDYKDLHYFLNPS